MYICIHFQSLLSGVAYFSYVVECSIAHAQQMRFSVFFPVFFRSLMSPTSCSSKKSKKNRRIWEELFPRHKHFLSFFFFHLHFFFIRRAGFWQGARVLPAIHARRARAAGGVPQARKGGTSERRSGNAPESAADVCACVPELRVEPSCGFARAAAWVCACVCV